MKVVGRKASNIPTRSAPPFYPINSHVTLQPGQNDGSNDLWIRRHQLYQQTIVVVWVELFTRQWIQGYL
jgi:hypothetical protein